MCFFIKGDHAWGWWDNKYYVHLGRKYLDSLTVALLVEYLSEYEREDESDVWWSEILIQQNGKKHEQISYHTLATRPHNCIQVDIHGSGNVGEWCDTRSGALYWTATRSIGKRFSVTAGSILLPKWLCQRLLGNFHIHAFSCTIVTFWKSQSYTIRSRHAWTRETGRSWATTSATGNWEAKPSQRRQSATLRTCRFGQSSCFHVLIP